MSSTYLDLKDPREKVIQGLLEADCFPAGMEMFPASDLEKWDLIKGVIDDSDYYLLIIGGRYGSEGGEHSLSYTEQEFDYAVSQKKPVMAFLHQDPGSLRADQTDKDADKEKKLEAFREKVEQRMVKYWASSDQLAGLVAQALIKLRKTHPTVGWVRGDHALTPEKELEISELKREVERLRGEVSRKHEQQESISNLSSGDDEVELSLHLKFKKVELNSTFTWDSGWVDVTTSWNHLLSHMGPTLLQESTEDEFNDALVAAAKAAFWEPGNRPDKVKAIREVQLSTEDFGTVLVQFRVLNYLEQGQQKRPPSDIRKYWKLTAEGANRLMHLRAIRKPDIVVSDCDEVTERLRLDEEARD